MAEEGSSHGGLKRSFVEDDESSKPPSEKRVRFPKGKKVKQGDHVAGAAPGDDALVAKDPNVAARNRAVRRSKFQKVLTEEYADAETFGFATDVRKAEFQYQDNEEFIDEGVPLEPFNLEQEREEGYFDDNGNYVEYMNKQIKDAWLDGVDLCEKYVEKRSTPMNNDEKPHDLSTEELAAINRRIADALEPGETVLRALRRLKGSTDKRQKMSAETKNLFDQLTEDAMKLMENGDYNVYDEKQEHFEREAEGYEKLVNARKHGLPEGLSKEISEDMFDMFGDDEGKAADTPATTGNGSFSVQAVEGGEMQNDYVYDESSGYYYNSNLGYYYDPSTGLYGCAATGKWYSYNEESGAYDEIQQDVDVDVDAARMS